MSSPLTHEFRVGNAERLEMEDQSVDLVFGSPPYCDARTYGIDARRGCADWIEWMLAVTSECLRVSKGAVVWIAAGVTRKRNYWPACEGLMYQWWANGGSLYRPCYWHRVGIPGSGGDQWFRADVEYAMCFKRDGKLPWTDNTACGHPPKYGPGGEMSHRMSDGTRVNQWGRASGATAARRPNGKRDKGFRPSHQQHTKQRADGEMEIQHYDPPVLANPGTFIEIEDADEWPFGAALEGIAVGGGHMGSKLAHENEAPFPEKLARFFVLSLCPPGGTVLDPFSGSGTTVAVCKKEGRSGIGIDIRESQCELGRRRLLEGNPTKE